MCVRGAAEQTGGGSGRRRRRPGSWPFCLCRRVVTSQAKGLAHRTPPALPCGLRTMPTVRAALLRPGRSGTHCCLAAITRLMKKAEWGGNAFPGSLTPRGPKYGLCAAGRGHTSSCHVALPRNVGKVCCQRKRGTQERTRGLFFFLSLWFAFIF